MIPIAAGTFGAGLVVFSFSRSMALSMVLLMFAGFGQMVNMATGNTLLQTMVDDDKRGQVMSLYTMSIMGMMPLGSLMGVRGVADRRHLDGVSGRVGLSVGGAGVRPTSPGVAKQGAADLCQNGDHPGDRDGDRQCKRVAVDRGLQDLSCVGGWFSSMCLCPWRNGEMGSFSQAKPVFPFGRIEVPRTRNGFVLAFF